MDSISGNLGYVDNGSDMKEDCHVALCPSEAKCYTQ